MQAKVATARVKAIIAKGRSRLDSSAASLFDITERPGASALSVATAPLVR
jgi:hypothetical protein